MTSIPLEGKTRKESGTSAAKQARKEGLVPCILYGGESNVSFVAPYLKFNKMIFNSEFYTVDLTIDGTLVNYGNVIILTNATKEWVLYSSRKYIPKVHTYFKDINIIHSASKK